jgi:hypothetical protein
MSKVKELKDDALVNVEVNKSFYFMVKNTLFYLFRVMEVKEEEREGVLKQLMSKAYNDMSHWEQAFYTTTLLLAEIERQASITDQYQEVDVETPSQD